ncbi:MAG: hypothetical protein IJ115_02400 [Erysipelotrichaceae bacterium]|nr:hypothetical protein [Erysipelotrichaceae bacterium]
MQSVFIGMEEVRETLNISQAEAYRVIKRLNDELAEKGYLIVRGRTNRKYLEDRLYHVTLSTPLSAAK